MPGKDLLSSKLRAIRAQTEVGLIGVKRLQKTLSKVTKAQQPLSGDTIKAVQPARDKVQEEEDKRDCDDPLGCAADACSVLYNGFVVEANAHEAKCQRMSNCVQALAPVVEHTEAFLKDLDALTKTMQDVEKNLLLSRDAANKSIQELKDSQSKGDSKRASLSSKQVCSWHNCLTHVMRFRSKPTRTARHTSATSTPPTLRP